MHVMMGHHILFTEAQPVYIHHIQKAAAGDGYYGQQGEKARLCSPATCWHGIDRGRQAWSYKQNLVAHVFPCDETNKLW